MCHMARQIEACDECSRNCFRIHQGKRDLSQRVPPFFKVMFGKKISEIMCVPPRVSRNLELLVGEKAYLEDSTGKKWEVILSEAQGSIAFKQGWQTFFRDHSLEQGDFVLFRNITGSHFIVEIYGRSGYEKTLPGAKSYHNKRLKTTRNSITRKSPSDSLHEERELELAQENDCFNAYAVPQSDTDIIQSQDNVSNVNAIAGNAQSQGNVIERPQLVPEADLLEDLTLQTERKTTFTGEDDREILFDLSVFELPDMKPSFARKDDEDNPSDLFKPMMNEKKVNVRKHLFDSSASKMTDMKVDANNHIDELQLQGNPCSKVPGTFHEDYTKDASIVSNKPPVIQGNAKVTSKKCEPKLSKYGCNLVPGVPLTSIPPLKIINKSSGKTMPVVKQEPGDFEDFFCDVTSFGVKSEPVDCCDFAPASVIKITCSIPPDNESFLELPEPFPIKWRQRMSLKHKLIVLRNPAGIDWPVLYINRHGLNALSSGWKAFKKANNIRPGDECAFLVDKDTVKALVRVQILNR